MSAILTKLSFVPHCAGVYQMRDSTNQVIYIGKAKNLFNRLSSYFKSGTHDAKTTAMLSKVADFEYFVCKTENDALAMEANLINRHKPHYNILLKDNKAFPYILIADNSIEITRRLHKRGKYFGPYFNGIWAGGLLDTLYDIFSVRDKADGPTMEKIKQFLSGQNDFNAREVLTEKMEGASQMQQYELAIRYRNGISFLDKLGERIITNVPRDVNCDVFACASGAEFFVVSVITVRAGKLIGIQNFSAKNNSPNTEEEKLEEFIAQYYLKNIAPNEIVTSAIKGFKRELLNMAQKNAKEYLNTSIEKIKHRDEFTVGACVELGKILNIETPRRIECFDISHMGGEDAVAGMVVFIDGEPEKKEYRKFKTRAAVAGRLASDDYESMVEVIKRRLARSDENFVLPDLIVLDGGVGQLNSVLKSVQNAPKMIAFGGENDAIFDAFAGEIRLNPHSFAQRLLTRIRDEAHRFCNYYRKQLRRKP